jgi:hypothetical protein
VLVTIDICDDAGPAHETGEWADIADHINLPTNQVGRVAILNNGTTGGRPAVLIASEAPGGAWYVTEITGDMWETIAGAIRGARARWGVADRP